MSNLLNELSITMKEISRAENRLAELESKESELSSKILLNKEATKVLIETGIIVGAELLRYHSVSRCFTLSDAPAFAHEINFDEPKDESKNPFNVGDKATHEAFGREEFEVTEVAGDLVVGDHGAVEGSFGGFSLVKE